MKAVATILNNILLADANLQAVVEGKHYWELVPEEDQEPYIAFSITENAEATKERSGDYDIRVSIYGLSLDNVSEVDALTKIALEGQHGVTRIFNRGAQSGYTDEEVRKAIIIRNFNLKTRI
jgi:hypothetical protein